MSVEKHTRGPWHQLDIEGKEAHVFGADKYQVADCESYKRSSEECLANAALIAAAPDMAEALKYALPVLEWHVKDAKDRKLDHYAILDVQQRLDCARAALAKAGVK